MEDTEAEEARDVSGTQSLDDNRESPINDTITRLSSYICQT
jgi:hypothetical protein